VIKTVRSRGYLLEFEPSVEQLRPA